ncbi:MAG: esterase [Rhodococcus erythropolis]|jgi:alpha-beta hydrolase superfamily lysophospholipase|uniref:Alpha/beta fold hydrolase n=1 Tax=Rhodococcus erythropolis TaxID=1833 RepID=A0A8I1D7F0_RHOER|nr:MULTISPECIES: alpha/beta fold hydrolase [Rhodococcus]MBH5144031.1 alpha/beta fold hydrolase [Rhodococcus erythropolis]MCS4257786.1 alpha-beta hydrolase superfamily lysophospholipase [Rhodococcus erythropolis]MCW2425728.1 alpha-beta hydrolase superfamily lysophospholipase [Rhodococcus erythropolis]MDF2896719.1 esterase [Rhodococcus erythropolis]MDI9905801.1 alpha/beta fold hydrolase [Rhodococcus sp. IEGM 1406]
MTSMPFFDGRTGQVHFRHWPAAGGAVPTVSLVFLHGLGQHSGQYHRFAGAMTASGIDVWAIDHTGHGLSEGDPGVGAPLSDLAADAAALADIALAELPDVPQAVMGHSLGAVTALTVLAHRDHEFASAVLCGIPRSAVEQHGWAELSDAGIPVLVVHGTDDRIAPVDPVRDWARTLRNVEMREFEDAGHDLLHEKVHASVTNVSREFLLAHSR